LAALYADAVRLLQAEQYQEALEKWGEVQARDPRYPDRQGVHATARKKLEALARGAPPRRGLPRWAVVAIAGLAVVAILAVVLLLRGRAALPSPVSDLLSDARILYHDDFDELSQSHWDYQSIYTRASGGLVEITGTQSCPKLWYVGTSIYAGEGVLVLFQFDPGAGFEIQLEAGTWKNPDFKRWGILFYKNQLAMDVQQGDATIDENPLDGDLTLEPGVWYYLLLAINPDTDFVARIWDRDDPSRYSAYRTTFDAEWKGLEWVFAAGASLGKLYVDAFTEISFSELR
jgi:hypothetical protein